MHVLRHRAVGNAAVDEDWRELLELGPQLPGDFDVHFREPEPLPGVYELGENQRRSLGVDVSRDDSRTARHLFHLGAGVQGIGVVPQDAPGKPRALPVLVGANVRLARHVLAREYKRRTTDHRSFQHVVRLLVWSIQLGWLVAPARLQRLAQDVLLGYPREGDCVLEDVHPKTGVELLHLLERLQEGGDVQIVVVLQPVTEVLHAPLAEDAMAVVVFLERKGEPALELGVPGQVWWKPWEVQLVRAVEPLVREPGFGKRGAVCLDPLVVSDAGGQVVHNIQEVELERVDEHDATVLLRGEDIVVSDHERDKVLADELEVVVARVEAQHRHLGEPLRDTRALAYGNFLWVWGKIPRLHSRYDCCVAALKGLVEAVNQVSGVAGDDVLRLMIERVRDGN